MKVLMILTSHDQMGDSDHKTGFWLEEFAAPYYVLKDGGVEVDLASPAGGQPPVDPSSEAPDALTEATQRFKDDQEAQTALANSRKLAEVSAADYEGVFLPGGHGPLWDLVKDEDSLALIEAFYDAGKPIAAVCHAPAALLKARKGDGSPIVMGKAVTGFSNEEETEVGLAERVPFMLEDELQAEGGRYIKLEPWQVHTVVDGNLITGQNPASSKETAQALLKQMK